MIDWEAATYYSASFFTGEKPIDSKEFLEEFKREIDASERPGQLADIMNRYSFAMSHQTRGRFFYRLADEYCK